MKVERLSIPGAAVVGMDPLVDPRGVFCRWFCQQELHSLVGARQIVNVNYSRTDKVGAVRGMHFQHPPKAEMKLVRCLHGRVFDVMVDLRKDSPTLLKWHGEILTAENMKMMVIPEGVAHGFQALERQSEMLYLHTEYYSMEHDAGIRHNDPLIGVEWLETVTDVSAKDQTHPLLDRAFEGVNV